MSANLISKQKPRDSYYLVQRHKPWQDTCGFSYLAITRDTLAREDVDSNFFLHMGKTFPPPQLVCQSGLCLKLLLCSSHLAHMHTNTHRVRHSCLGNTSPDLCLVHQQAQECVYSDPFLQFEELYHPCS